MIIKVNSGGNVVEVVEVPNVDGSNGCMLTVNGSQLWLICAGGAFVDRLYICNVSLDLGSSYCREYSVSGAYVSDVDVYGDLLIMANGIVFNSSSGALLIPDLQLDPYGTVDGRYIYSGGWGNGVYNLMKCDVVAGECYRYGISELSSYWLMDVVVDGDYVYYLLGAQSGNSVYPMYLKLSSGFSEVKYAYKVNEDLGSIGQLFVSSGKVYNVLDEGVAVVDESGVYRFNVSMDVVPFSDSSGVYGVADPGEYSGTALSYGNLQLLLNLVSVNKISYTRYNSYNEYGVDPEPVGYGSGSSIVLGKYSIRLSKVNDLAMETLGGFADDNVVYYIMLSYTPMVVVLLYSLYFFAKKKLIIKRALKSRK